MTDKTEKHGTIGNYELLEELSKSSRSRVYKAVQPPSQHPVVVKVLPPAAVEDPEQLAQFHQEVGALREINHSNVALILDSGQDEQSLYLVMEFVPLTPLSQVLRRRRLTLAEAMTVFKNVCLGLQSVHEKKVAHRNLNPTSVLVSDDLSMVKVAGFGSRADLSSQSNEMETMATGRLNVAFHYVAPERGRGAEATPRGDIYSVGVILYEMLTGRLPMGRVGLPSRINADLPAEIDRLVLDCLASEPEERFASVDQVLQATRRLEDKLRLGVVSEFTGLVRGTGKVVRHRASMVALLAVVGASSLGLAGYWLLARGGDKSAEQLAAEANTLRVEATDTTPGPLGDMLSAPPPPTGDGDGTIGSDGSATRPTAPDAPRSAAAPEVEKAETEAQTSQDPASGSSVEEDLAVAREKLDAGLATAALTDLEEIVSNHPDSPAALDAYLLMAQIHTGLEQPQKARAELVEAKNRFSSDSRTAEAVYMLADLTAAEKDKGGHEQALGLYSDVANNYPRSPWAPKALDARARLEDAENLKVNDSEFDRKVPASLATRRELVRKYAKSRYSEAALWALGETYRDLKVFDQAAQMYSTLGRSFPETRRDVWWEAAQLYDKRLDDKAAAVKAYSKVPNSSSHFDGAQKRLKKLGG